jgi:hypothetical protein
MSLGRSPGLAADPWVYGVVSCASARRDPRQYEGRPEPATRRTAVTRDPLRITTHSIRMGAAGARMRAELTSAALVDRRGVEACLLDQHRELRE